MPQREAKSPEVAELTGRVRALEAQVQAKDIELATLKARFDQLTAGLEAQAAKLKEAQRVKRTVELHAAAIVEAHGGEAEVSAAAVRKLSPDTKLDLHEHSESCRCKANDGVRFRAKSSRASR